MVAFQPPGREPLTPQGKRQRIVFPAMRRETAEVKRCPSLLRRAACILDMRGHRVGRMQQPPNPCDLKSRRPLPRALDEQQTTRQRPEQLFVAVLMQAQRDTQSRQ